MWVPINGEGLTVKTAELSEEPSSGVAPSLVILAEPSPSKEHPGVDPGQTGSVEQAKQSVHGGMRSAC
jgi:hypothetical protein